MLCHAAAHRTPQSGTMEVLYPDLMRPEYSRCLKAATAGLNIVDAPTDTPTVCVPADNSLQLTVSFHLPPPDSLSHLLLQPPDSEQCTAVMNESDRLSPTVQWLMETARLQDGYAAFKQGRHHVQANADVVALWSFAVQFSERYSQTPSPVQVREWPLSQLVTHPHCPSSHSANESAQS